MIITKRIFVSNLINNLKLNAFFVPSLPYEKKILITNAFIGINALITILKLASIINEYISQVKEYKEDNDKKKKEFKFKFGQINKDNSLIIIFIIINLAFIAFISSNLSADEKNNNLRFLICILIWFMLGG